MHEFAAHQYANVHRGIHRLSETATAVYEGARDRASQFLSAPADSHLVITRGTTESINLVAATWGAVHVDAGDTILLTAMEHHSNLLPWQALAARRGAELAFVPTVENGSALDIDAARNQLESKPKLFAFTHVSNTLGCKNPAAELCALARSLGVATLVDGAQAVGHLHVDLSTVDPDFYAFSAHKMCGPSGIGFLYARPGILDPLPPWHYGGEMVERAGFEQSTFRPPPARFEAGTPPIIEASGVAAAIDYLEAIGMNAIEKHSVHLANACAAQLRALPGIHVFGPNRRGSGIVTFAVDGIHPHDLAFFLDQKGVAIRAGHHCAQPLMRSLNAPATARASFYLYNTMTDVEELTNTLRAAIRFFRE